MPPWRPGAAQSRRCDGHFEDGLLGLSVSIQEGHLDTNPVVKVVMLFEELLNNLNLIQIQHLNLDRIDPWRLDTLWTFAATRDNAENSRLWGCEKARQPNDSKIQS